MSRMGVRLVVICEDDEHCRFSRRALVGLGFHYRELRFSISPAGRGAAEQWVREQYPSEVKTYRRKARSQYIGLIVLIDADSRSVQERHDQLDAILREQTLPPRSSHEAIVLCIPRRHIETWIAFLLGRQVDETTDCKAMVRNEDYRMPARRFVELHRGAANRPVNLPSMERAFAELKRLPMAD